MRDAVTSPAAHWAMEEEAQMRRGRFTRQTSWDQRWETVKRSILPAAKVCPRYALAFTLRSQYDRSPRARA